MRLQQRRKRFFAALTMLYAVLLVVFCITRFRLLFWLLGNPLLPETGVNLIPFASLMQGIRQYGGLSWDMLGNLLMYVPVGVMFCYWHNARWWQNALLGAGVSVAVELLQLLLHTGSCDVDDFLVNALGSFAGAAAFALILQLCKGERNQAREVVEIIATLFVPFLVIYVADFFSGGENFLFGYLALVAVYFWGCGRWLLRDLTPRQKRWYGLAAVAVGLWFFLFFLIGPVSRAVRMALKGL